MTPSLLLLLLAGCPEYDLNRDKDTANPGKDDSNPIDVDTSIQDSSPPGACEEKAWPAAEVGLEDNCEIPPVGGFEPITEWEYGTGKDCLSLPVVADLTGDGRPEILVNLLTISWTSLPFLQAPYSLVVLHGDGSGVLWEDTTASLAFGSSPAVGDVDGDGEPEIVAVRQYDPSAFGNGDYTTILYEADGTLVWESEHYTKYDFNWAAYPIISDMEHDGDPEIIVGRVILRADGTTRGVGEFGQGSYGAVDMGGFGVSEGSIPAVTDLDLDGVEEIIVGDAAYDADGNALRYDPSQDDAMIGVANLDSDPEGETVAISGNTVRAQDTDGSILWGPIEIKDANILSTPAIGDVDQDGLPEIITAGGNKILCLNHDGTILWDNPVTDMSGATGATIFDFEGDGTPEVLYLDEVEIVAYDGPTGTTKFLTRDHSSNTMFDYPVVADVDNDDHAEILACHAMMGMGTAFSVFGERTDTWMPARSTWNQHAYFIDNVNDDLSIPVTATPNFTTHNTWHSAISTEAMVPVGDDMAAEILDVCLEECDAGRVEVVVRVNNVAYQDLAAGIQGALYAVKADTRTLLATFTVPDILPSGWGTEGIRLEVEARDLSGADSVWLSVDDDGTGRGVFTECSELNNGIEWDGPFCGD